MAKKGGKKKFPNGTKKNTWDKINMPAKLDAVTGWAKEGYIDAEIAKMLGISTSLLYEWKRKHPEFAEAILKGKAVADGELVNAAFRNATGYYIEVEEPVKLRDQYGAEHVEMVRYKKYVPANSTQSIFMLKNRLPDQYRDKQEIKHDGQVGVSFIDDVPGDDIDE